MNKKISTFEIAMLAFFGALNAVIELSLGTYLSAMKIPFFGAVMVSLNIIVYAAGRTFVPRKGSILAMGFITSFINLLLAGGFKPFSVMAIFFEAGLMEIIMSLLGMRLYALLLSGVTLSLFSMFWAVIGPAVLFFHRNAVEQFAGLAGRLFNNEPLVRNSIIVFVFIVVVIHIINGLIAGRIAWEAHKTAKKISEKRGQVFEKWSEIAARIFGEGTKIIFPRYFISKKNQVTLLEMEKNGDKLYAVAKFFVWGDIDKEWDTLLAAYKAGIKVPKPLKKYDNILFMEYIPGKTLYIAPGADLDTQAAIKTGAWLGKFHKSFTRSDGLTLLKGDGMLPNFIIHDETGELYGVDFEESKYGRPDEDISDIAATMILAGFPPLQVGFERAKAFIDAYLKENNINIEIESFMEKLCLQLEKRKKFMPGHAEEIEAYIGAAKYSDIL